jgi:UDP-2,3-diacylglucosamine pyrophosphatase LpxH
MELIRRGLRDWAAARDSVFARSATAGAPAFQLQTVMNEQGQKQLAFAAMFLTDTHLSTKGFSAQATCQMLEQTRAARHYYLGDDIDIDARQLQQSGGLNNPWQRQYIGHVLRKAAEAPTVKLIGNHDVALNGRRIPHEGKNLWHRRLTGKNIFGVAVKYQHDYQDGQGRTFRLLHAHQVADAVLGTSKGALYLISDIGYAALPQLDKAVAAVTGAHDYHITHGVRARFDTGLGLSAALARVADRNPQLDGIIHGHFHRPDIARTPGGKLVIDAGSFTEHPRALVEDARGTKALLTWHPDRIVLREENGAQRVIAHQALGLNVTQPKLHEDKFTQQADRLIGLVQRLWPVAGEARVPKHKVATAMGLFAKKL